jgi:Phage tail protein (Tail_P2_I)
MSYRRAQLPDTVAEPPFDMGETGRDLYAATPTLARLDLDNDYAWAKYLAALSELLDVIAVMVRDDADGNLGWTALASPTRCPEPFLRVLAQWAGIRRWDAMSPDDLRELIGPRAPGLWRGTRDAMIAAARRFLPPGTAQQYLYFEERADGDPYALRVFTYTFIDHDPALVEAALQAAKPAGLQLTYQVRRGQNWDMLRTRTASWDDVNTTYESWDHVHHDEPIAPRRPA